MPDLKIIILLLFAPCFLQAQKDSVLSGFYKWKEPVTKNRNNTKSTVLLQGMVYDMKWMNITSNVLAASKKENKITIPVDEEQIFIIKKGKLDITMKDQQSSLIAGSVIVLMPGEKLSFRSLENECEFFHLRYKSKLPVDKARGENAGGSFIKDFSKIEFRPHDKGGIRSYFERSTAMGKRLEMHVTTLNPGIKSHDPHTHRAEEIVLMIDGNTEMQIGQQFYQGTTGDLYYLGSNVPHAIKNIGDKPCMYFAFQFE